MVCFFSFAGSVGLVWLVLIFSALLVVYSVRMVFVLGFCLMFFVR
jgi:hypothetical protein